MSWDTMQKKLAASPRRRLFTPDELAFIREHHGAISCVEIARRLDRTPTSISKAVGRMGLPRTTPIKFSVANQRRLRALVKQQLCNRHIADELQCMRNTIADWRSRMGLPPCPDGGTVMGVCPRCQHRVKATTAKQLQEAGVESLVHLRLASWRKFARESGWPEDLRPRSVQILNTLYERGPMTRKQLAEAIGMRTDYTGSRPGRHILKSNDSEGSYLAHLQARGLVMRLGRVVRGKRRGESVNLYALPSHVDRQQAM